MAHLKLGWEKNICNTNKCPLRIYKILVASKGMQKKKHVIFQGVTSDTLFAGEFLKVKLNFKGCFPGDLGPMFGDTLPKN